MGGIVSKNFRGKSVQLFNAVIFAILFPAFSNAQLSHFCGERFTSKEKNPHLAAISKIPYNAIAPIKTETGLEWYTDSILFQDRFGEVYTIAQLRAYESKNMRVAETGGETPLLSVGSPSSVCITSNDKVEIRFYDKNGVGFDDPVFGAERKAVVCQVWEDLSNLLSFQSVANLCNPHKKRLVIEIWESERTNISSTYGTLGRGSSYYNFINNGRYGNVGVEHGEVWRVINTGSQTYSAVMGQTDYPHGYMQFNFAPNIIFNTDLNQTQIDVRIYDLYQVALHEAFHVLGVASRINADGSQRNLSYTAWDEQLSNSNGVKLIDYTLTNPYDYKFNAAALGGGSILTNNGCDLKIEASGVNKTVFAPAAYSYGTSLSHLDNNCSTPARELVMHPSYQFPNSNGQQYNPLRKPSVAEVQALCAIGYVTTGNFGNGSFAHHFSNLPAACGSRFVARFDGDGCNGFYNTTTCSTYSILYSRLLANDFGQGYIDSSFVQVVSGGGTLSFNPTGFTFSSNSIGQNILRYKMRDANGRFSNYAYIFILVYTCPPPIPSQNISADLDCKVIPFIPGIDGCNIICNPKISHNPNCTELRQNSFSDFKIATQTATAFTCPNGELRVPGWISFEGTPDFYLNGPQTYANCFDNQDPRIGVFTSSYQGFMGNEGVLTSVPVSAGKKYLFSYVRGARPEQIASPYVFLYNKANNTRQTVIKERGVVGCKRVVTCFNTTSNFDQLRMYGDPPVAPDLIDPGYYYFNHVELLEDNFSAGPDKIIQCNEMTAIGVPHCAPEKTTFTWVNVTDGNIQIYQGTNPVLQVAPSKTTTYKITRSFGSFGIVTNAADHTDEVTVVVENEVNAEFAHTAVCRKAHFFSASEFEGNHLWNFGDGSASDTSKNPVHVYQIPGNYTVTHQFSNNCGVAAVSKSVVLIDTFNSSAVQIASSTPGASNGIAAAIPNGGSAPYVYVWSNGLTQNTAGGLSAGYYSVTILDANQCVSKSKIEIRDSIVVLTVNSVLTKAACFGQSNGAASVSVSGGQLPYTYLWSNGATTSEINNLPAGEYSLIVTDANQISATISVSILSLSSSLSVSASVTSNPCAATVSISATATGGSGGYSYSWSNGANASTVIAPGNSSYKVTVTDNNNCSANAMVNIAPLTPLMLKTTVVNDCRSSDGATVSLNVSGGAPPYLYSIGSTVFTTNAAFNGLQSGTYTVQARDQNSCVVSGRVIIQ